MPEHMYNVVRFALLCARSPVYRNRNENNTMCDMVNGDEDVMDTQPQPSKQRQREKIQINWLTSWKLWWSTFFRSLALSIFFIRGSLVLCRLAVHRDRWLLSDDDVDNDFFLFLCLRLSCRFFSSFNLKLVYNRLWMATLGAEILSRSYSNSACVCLVILMVDDGWITIEEHDENEFRCGIKFFFFSRKMYFHSMNSFHFAFRFIWMDTD